MYDVMALETSIASGLGLYVFPAYNQTKDTQEADEVECYKWAKEQTGIDPTNPPQVEVKEDALHLTDLQLEELPLVL